MSSNMAGSEAVGVTPEQSSPYVRGALWAFGIGVTVFATLISYIFNTSNAARDRRIDSLDDQMAVKRERVIQNTSGIALLLEHVQQQDRLFDSLQERVSDQTDKCVGTQARQLEQIQANTRNVALLVERTAQQGKDVEAAAKRAGAIEDEIHQLSDDPKARRDPFTGSEGRLMRSELRGLIDSNERRLDLLERASDQAKHCCTQLQDSLKTREN